MCSSMPSFMNLHRLAVGGPSTINMVRSVLGDTDEVSDVGSCEGVAVADCGNDGLDGGSGVTDACDIELTDVRITGVCGANGPAN